MKNSVKKQLVTIIVLSAAIGMLPLAGVAVASQERAAARTRGDQQRVATLPEVPTIAESGLPGYEAVTWFGFFAPDATPRDIVAKLNADAVAGLNPPEVRERLAGQGYFVVASAVEPFAAFVNSEIPRWAKVVKEANVKPE